MRLDFSQEKLMQMLGLFAALLVLFGGGLAFAMWAATEPSPKRVAFMALSPLLLVVSAWGVIWTLWLLTMKYPAAAITASGIQVASFFYRRSIPWGAIDAIAMTEFTSGKTTLPVIQVTRRNRSPIRIPMMSLSSSSSEIESWIHRARSLAKGDSRE